ncbi:uncharacterized protein [Choristoneura fumiferana]|uniref:uncharacterized protein n=1 Tax=Choristoneura fumiferana TaxID=7141 RepID=UPI003D15BB38
MDLSQESFGMEEDDEQKNTANKYSQWQLSSASPESQHYSCDSNEYFQSSAGHELQILQKKETTLNRPIIPATKYEKLAFTRSYVASSCKTEFAFLEKLDFSIFFWNYLYNVFGKSFPSSYLYIFLGSYAPEHHLFVTKMVPLFYGLNIVWIIVGLLQLIQFASINVIYLDYAICGTLYNNPWNRCQKPQRLFPDLTINISCYVLEDFIGKIKTNTVMSHFWAHEDLTTNEYFHLSQYIYHLDRTDYLLEARLLEISFYYLYIIFHFFLSSLLCNQIFKRNIWKAQAFLHYMLTVVYAVALMHLYYLTFEAHVSVVLPEIVETVMKADVDLLAESMTSPPVLHILTSRSKQEVKIGTDAVLLVTSNAVYYIFRGIVEYKLRKYCTYVTKSLQYFAMGPGLIFFWPLYLSNLYLGNMYTVLFLYLVFFVEFCSFTITYQCMIEVFVCQWPRLNRWTAALIILVATALLSYPWLGQRWWELVDIADVCAGNFITLAEITIICFIYPLGRLVEDITFHSGIAPTLFTTFILRAMFIHYLYKSFTMLSNINQAIMAIEEELKIALLVLVFIVIIGIILKLYRIVYKMKKHWTLIWRPDKYWGPSDLSLRLLRKKFKSDKYVVSQAPRDLSRNLIGKTESSVYRLGLRYSYDPHRRSTQHNVTYRIKNELK